MTTELHAEMIAAASPTPADLTEARSLILEMLSGGATIHRDEVEAELRRRRGVVEQSEHVALVRDSEGSLQLVDREQPHLLVMRSREAVREMLGRLHAEGDILPVGAGRDGLVEQIVPGWTPQGTHYAKHRPARPSLVVESETRWRLTRPEADHPAELFTRAGFTEGLADVLGPRGVRCLDEAYACWRRGLYLAAGNLLGAASEAAWYTLAAVAVAADGRISKALDDAQRGNIGTAIERVSEHVVKDRLPAAGRINELKATAYHLRDVRNYGLHPRTDLDQDREAHFTESGTTALILSARRYFGRLAEVHAALAGRL